MLDLFSAEFEAVLHPMEGVFSYQEKLVRILAIVHAMTSFNYWMEDNEDTEAVGELVHRIAKYLQGTLLAKDDFKLGLGPVGATPAQQAESREALYVLLDFYAKEFAKVNCKFLYKPGKKRRPRGSNGAAADVYVAVSMDFNILSLVDHTRQQVGGNVDVTYFIGTIDEWIDSCCYL